jgi:hypothetical protein
MLGSLFRTKAQKQPATKRNEQFVENGLMEGVVHPEDNVNQGAEAA